MVKSLKVYDLLPCPFCGGNAKYLDRSNTRDPYANPAVICQKCHANICRSADSFCIGDSPEPELVALWNTRI